MNDLLEYRQLAKIKKILILQYKPFGDVLLNTGYLPYLKKKFPDAKIDYLIRKPYDTILEDNPNINELIIFQKSIGFKYFLRRLDCIAKIRRRKYDLVIDQLKGSGSAIITMLSGAKYRLGYKESRFSFAYNIKAVRGPLRYYAAMKFDLLKPLGMTEQSYKLHYKIKDESKLYIKNWLEEKGISNKEFICVSPGSPVEKKRWDYKNYAKLCDMILENTEYKIVLMKAPDEEEAVNNVIKCMKKEALISPPTTFNHAGALLQKAKLLICNDGGLNHLSIAVETASLAIFGDTNPLKWSGFELGNHYYLKNREHDYSKDNFLGITPQEVYEKFIEITL